MDELQTLFPEKIIKVHGEDLVLKPLTFGQLPKAIKIVEKLGGLFETTFKKSKVTDANTVMKFITLGGDDFIDLMCLGVGKPREWFDTLPMDEGISLTISFIEVNVSFFTQRVLPMMLTATEQITSTYGQKRSSTSKKVASV